MRKQSWKYENTDIGFIVGEKCTVSSDMKNFVQLSEEDSHYREKFKENCILFTIVFCRRIIIELPFRDYRAHYTKN